MANVLWYHFAMLNLQQLLIRQFVREIRTAYDTTYSIMEPNYANMLEWAGNLALEYIANTDALYHNVDHTVLVTLVGQTLLKGKHLSEGGVTPKDWTHYVLALLCHDIGYIKGACRADGNGRYATGTNNETIELPYGGTDALLSPYHVDRGKMFIRERFGGKLLMDIDVELICSYIEMTRFPIPDGEFYQDTSGFHGLVRAADFIGQLGDPDYLRKIPALFYEFEEIGANARNGYKSPGDMRRNYTTFYWKVVRPYIQNALGYLRITQEGKQWIANLHSHVFDVEHNEAPTEIGP